MREILASSSFRHLRVHLTRVVDAPEVEGPPAIVGEGRVAVRGLVCGLCAARTESALRSVPGVESARVDLTSTQVALHLSPGASVSREQLQRALEGVVIAMPARRAIARIAAAFGRRVSRPSHDGGGVQR